MIQRRCACQRARRRGFTLTEVTVVMTMAGVLTAMSVPSFRRSMERSRADLAAAQLQSIWAAQQLYWLENRTYATDLSSLNSLGLLDSSITGSQGAYSFQITSANAATFAASATRRGSEVWSGTVTIDQAGAVSGTIAAAGLESIVPSLD